MPKRKLKTKAKIFLFFIMLFILGISVILYYDIKIRPIIKDIAVSTAQDYATDIINNSIYNILDNNNVNYEDIVDIKKDNDGNIIALTINTIKVNKLSNEIALELNRRTNEVNSAKVQVPLGNFFSIGFLSDRGPNISLSILPTSSISTQIQQEFTDAGINQTIHKISLKATVTFDLIFPTETTSKEYTSQILIAQTVIVGKVPNMYANINDNAQDAMSHVRNKNIITG